MCFGPPRSRLPIVLVMVLLGCQQAEQRSNQELVERARKATTVRDYETASKLWAQAVRQSDALPEYRWELASALLQKGETNGAVVHLEYLLETELEDPDPCVQIARDLTAAHRYGDADRVLSLVLKRDPRHVEALLLKGRLEEVWGQDQRALEVYLRALSIDPGSSAASLGIAEIHMRSNHPDRAAPIYRSVIVSTELSTRERVEIGRRLAIALTKLDRWSESVEALDQAIAAADLEGRANSSLVYERAYAKYRSGDLEGAIEDAEMVRRLSPEHTASQELLRVVSEEEQ